MNTQFNYIYRDGANDKSFNECDLIVEGELTNAELAPYLEMQHMFIPDQLAERLEANGIKTDMININSLDPELDHCFHEIALTPTDKEATVTKETFLNILKSIEWNSVFYFPPARLEAENELNAARLKQAVLLLKKCREKLSAYGETALCQELTDSGFLNDYDHSEIVILAWSFQNILDIAHEKNLNLTEEQAKQILRSIRIKYDPAKGVSLSISLLS